MKRKIVETYELRPEIEEDFRQMKDFWKLEDFKSTKYNYVTYHIIMTLIGYLYFHIYKNLEEGQAYITMGGILQEKRVKNKVDFGAHLYKGS